MTNGLHHELNDLPLFFVRHKLEASPELFQKWLSEGLLVVHYEKDIPDAKKASVDWRDFTGPGQKVVRRLQDCCANGADRWENARLEDKFINLPFHVDSRRSYSLVETKDFHRSIAQHQGFNILFRPIERIYGVVVCLSILISERKGRKLEGRKA